MVSLTVEAGKSQPPDIKAQLIDFAKVSRSFRSSYPNHFALVIDNCFTPQECEALIALAETEPQGWQTAQLNVGHGMQITRLDVRSSGRIIRDDLEVAGFIFERVRPFLSEVEVIARKGTKWRNIMRAVRNPAKAQQAMAERWEMTRLNERLRFLKYGPGQFFKPHMDGAFTTLQVRPNEPEERTFLTLQIYLRASPDLEGGATRFFGNDAEEHYDVESVPGRVLIFQHRHFLHSGHDVLRGEKIALRSDILYKQLPLFL